MANINDIPSLLASLRLPSMALHWQDLEDEAHKKRCRYADYLCMLLEVESNARYQRRVTRMTRAAKLPAGKTLASFDFTKAPSVNQPQFLALAQNTSWVEQARNLVIFGASGVGKTHLAVAIANCMIELGLRCLYSPTTLLVQQLQLAKKECTLPQFLDKLGRIPLLILDDIGYAKKDELETSVLFDHISHRYESSSIIITANQPFSEWASVFPNNMMAVAAVDRVIHHASVINIKEASYRKSSAE